jgi:hypothetical protein
MSTLIMLSAGQSDHEYTSSFHEQDPKNQKAARSCPRADDWKNSEEIELKTLWDMGTWDIVDIPEGVQLLPGTWSYKVKRDSDWNVSKRKARWNCRGYLQFPWEYNSTYSPTTRFAAIRQVLSLAAQEDMYLKHWDIAGAFCTADVDKDIYLQAPSGYPLPEGKCLKLVKSQYGLRQASHLFHADLEQWMLAYGFTSVGPDGVIFKLERGGHQLIVSLYVDDGLCATTSPELYAEFLKDLSKTYKLSDQGELKWYLGIGITHDRDAGVLTLSQEKYIDMLLDRFGLEDAHDAPTPFE